MAGNKRKKVVLSTEFQNDIKAVFEYGEDTFGFNTAKTFVSEIYMHVWNLDGQYLMFPEVRFLSTKNKKYRNIILGSYLIIYRIEAEKSRGIENLSFQSMHSSKYSYCKEN